MASLLLAKLPWFCASFIGTIVLVHLLRRPAASLNLVDMPGGRKSHNGPIPVVGGLAIFLVFVFAVLTVQEPLRPYAPLFAGMLLMLIGGVVDDVRELRSSSRFALQIAAATLVVSWAGLRIPGLGDLFGNGAVMLADWSVPFTMLCIVGLINAVNMIDGIDGLAGGFALVASLWMGAAAVLHGDSGLMLLIGLLGSAVAGFLVFNLRHPWRAHASVFLGDGGSMTLGFALAYFAIHLAAREDAVLAPMSIAWILGLPAIDAVSLMVRRLVKGGSPFLADREHLHHILLRAGFSDAQTAAILLGVAFFMGAVGFFGGYWGWSEPWMFAGFLGMTGLHVLAVLYAWRSAKVLRRLTGKLQ